MRRILLAVAALFGAAVVASAATVPYRTDAELVAISDRVVRGRVLDSVVERAPSGAIRTRTRVAVIEDFTGGADTILTVLERGGRLPDGTTVWIPGAPRFAPGDDVVLCLERTAGGYRTVSMGFSAFRVGAAVAGDRPLTRFGGTAVVGGRGVAGVEAARGLEEFRRAAGTVTGVARARRVDRSAGDRGGGGRDAAIASTSRSRCSATGCAGSRRTAVRRSPGTAIRCTPSPVQGADTDDQMRTALVAWTDPPTASIVLAFGGTRDVPIQTRTGRGSVLHRRQSRRRPDHVRRSARRAAGRRPRHRRRLRRRRRPTSSTARPSTPFTHGLVVLNDDAALEGFRTRAEHHAHPRARGRPRASASATPTQGAGQHHVSVVLPGRRCRCRRRSALTTSPGCVFIYPAGARPARSRWRRRRPLAGRSAARQPHGDGVARRPAPGPARRAMPWLAARADCGPAPATCTCSSSVAAEPRRAGAAHRATIAIAVGRPRDRSRRTATRTPTPTACSTSGRAFFGLDPAGGRARRARAAIPTATASRTSPSRRPARIRAAPCGATSPKAWATPSSTPRSRSFNPGAAAAPRAAAHPAGRRRRAALADAACRRVAAHRAVARLLESLTAAPFSTLIESDAPSSSTGRCAGTRPATARTPRPRSRRRRRRGISPKARRRATSRCSTCCRIPATRRRTATVRFLRPAPQPPIERHLHVAPQPRLTIPVDAVGAGAREHRRVGAWSPRRSRSSSSARCT